MKIRSSIMLGLLILCITPLSALSIPPPFELSMETACLEDDFQVLVTMGNWSGETMLLTVRRVQVAPALPGELILLHEMAVPSQNDPIEVLLSDPGIGFEDIGYLEATISWPDGSVYDTFTQQLSCSEQPYVMRGWLLETTLFQPCTGFDLLECDTVSLLYGDLNLFVGTGELLEIHGWTQYLNGRDDCHVTVVHIESLGVGVTCEDVVGATALTWGSIKAQYR